MNTLIVLYPTVVHFAYLVSVYNADSRVVNWIVLAFSFLPLIWLLRKRRLTVSSFLSLIKLSCYGALLLSIVDYFDPYYPKMAFDDWTVFLRFAVYVILYVAVLLVALLAGKLFSRGKRVPSS